LLIDNTRVESSRSLDIFRGGFCRSPVLIVINKWCGTNPPQKKKVYQPYTQTILYTRGRFEIISKVSTGGWFMYKLLPCWVASVVI
jgi:hypothetical protein